jgi:hypothetical protein
MKCKKLTRKKLTRTNMLAAALRCVGMIPYADAIKMTAHQVISLFEFHHIVYHTDTQNNEHYNLEPMLRSAHRERTKGDLKQIAKTKRIASAHRAHQELMKTPRLDRPEKSSRWPQRKFGDG